MLTMYDNHNAIKNERVATYNSASGGAVPSEFYLSQGNDKWRGKDFYVFSLKEWNRHTFKNKVIDVYYGILFIC